MRKALTVLTLVCSVGVVASQADVIERIVAKVNGEIITKTELDREVQALLEQLGPAATPEEAQRREEELRREVLERRVDSLLVLQVAEQRGLLVPPRYFEEWKTNVMKESEIETEEEFLRQVDLQGMTLDELQKQFEEGLLTQEIRRMEVDSKISVSEQEIEKHYREHIVEYTDPVKVRLREIVVRFADIGEAAAAEKAGRLLQDIHQGADFAEVARSHSDAASREAGGDLGFFEQRELTALLADVALQLAPGEVSDIIQMEKAFYIVRVEEKTEEKILSIDDVRKDIGESIFQENLEERTIRYMRQLRENAIIEIHS